MALCLVGEAWAGNPGGKLRSLVSSFKGTEGFDVVDLGGPALLLLKTVARAEADDPEDRAAMDLFRNLRRLTVIDFSEAAPEKKEKFLRKLDRILDGEEILMEAKDDGETMRIYGTFNEKTGKVSDVGIFSPTDGTFIFLSGSFNLEDISKIMDK